MTERTNIIIILGLILLAGIGLYLGKTDLAATCVGALGTALTTIMRSKSDDPTHPAGTADHNGV